jgi:pyrimidine operon attenuation protein/uracil phosphoribosyltransferase
MAARAVLSESDIDRTLRRIAHEIVEASPETSALVLLGIPTRGVVLAHRLAGYISDIAGIPVPAGSLDVTMYRAALDALTAIGRPRLVRLAVLVDRGHRELPIRADHVGKNLPTHHGERITVKLRDVDGTEEVQVVE